MHHKQCKKGHPSGQAGVRDTLSHGPLAAQGPRARKAVSIGCPHARTPLGGICGAREQALARDRAAARPLEGTDICAHVHACYVGAAGGGSVF